MDQFKKFFKKNTPKEKESARKKQLRRSRSVPLRDSDKENLRKPMQHGKTHLKASDVKFLNTQIGDVPLVFDALVFDPDFVLDIAPERSPSIGDKSFVEETKVQQNALMKILDDFPSPPKVPATPRSPLPDPSLRPKDRYELSKLCGLPVEDLLPPNPNTPWIPPTEYSRPLQERLERDAKRRLVENQGRPGISQSGPQGIYGNGRASHSTMTLCSSSRLGGESFSRYPDPRPLFVTGHSSPSYFSPSNYRTPSRTPSQKGTSKSHNGVNRGFNRAPPKGCVPVDVAEDDGMWGI